MVEKLESVECPEPVEGLSFVYILLCLGDRFYVGIADDVGARLRVHERGHGARNTRIFSPFRLVFVEGPFDRFVAAKREIQLKKWSRAKKIALITGESEELRLLSKSRD